MREKDYIIFECFLCGKKILVSQGEDYYMSDGEVLCENCFFDYYK